MGKITTLSPEELEFFAKSPSATALEAVEKTGDAEAIKLVKDYIALSDGRDLMVRGWTTEALSVLYKECGPEPVKDVWMNCYLPYFKANPDAFWGANFHDRVVGCMMELRMGLDCSIKVIDEDDEKLSFVMEPCMSGQKLVESGIYEGTACNCSPHFITGGLDDFPIYCTHNPVADMGVYETCGYIQKVTEFSEKVGSCSCTYLIYRNKDDIPEKYYTRSGLKKPEKK